METDFESWEGVKIMSKKIKIIGVSLLLIAAILLAVFFIFRSNVEYSSFEMSSITPKIKGFAWVQLLEDKAGDGKNKVSADGKSFSYFYEKETDMLWFRLETYNPINPNTPAVSVSIDIDANQNTGINWYGSNRKFTFEKMLSVGPIEKQGDKFIGYNGITNEQGVRERNWINENKNVIALYLDAESNAYILGVKRSEINPNLKKINVIGSVGANALWNDDVGESFATIDF